MRSEIFDVQQTLSEEQRRNTMNSDILDLQLPLSEETARELKLGQMVSVSGMVFTGRSQFHIRAIERDIFPPIDYQAVNGFFHVGPVMRQGDEGWEIVSIEPTSSIRFERYGADVVRKFGLRTLIGKTTMGPETAQALREVGGVHLSKIGLCGNQLAEQVKKIHDVHFLDELGKTEASWIFELRRFGPFFVGMDAHGNNYFEQLDAKARSRMEAINKQLGIPADFDFTNVNADGADGNTCKDML
ncbi:MAG: fumarate hydratase C-terminal domain-containing protein [Planctomycetota bacterium]|nr:fumarate hydratase C-terminal domain-containing protein [Planctomycetota bacterium]